MNPAETRQLFDALDKALASKNPTVKEALKELLIVTTLAEEPTTRGALSTLVNDMQRFEYELRSMRDEVYRLREELHRRKYQDPRTAREAWASDRASGGPPYFME